MKNNFIKKEDNNVIIYEGRLKSLTGDSRIPIDPNEKKMFQSIVVSRNGYDYRVKLDSYFRPFDKLNQKDKKRIFDRLNKTLLGSRIEFKGEIQGNMKETFHYGEIFIVSSSGLKQSLSDIIKSTTINLLRSESLQIDAAFLFCDDHENITLSYKGQIKNATLDLFDSSAHLLNKHEKRNLGIYINELMKDKKVKVEITGLLDDKWVVKIGTLNSTVTNLLDNKHSENSYSALISKVVDGDTVNIYKSGKRIPVRLADIDAPEKNQEFGHEATTFLRNLLSSKNVTVESDEKGHYGRTIGTLKTTINGSVVNANREMVKQGYAFCSDGSKKYKKEQDYADKNFLGIWKNTIPIGTTRPNRFRRFMKNK